jgi:8-oxo-dGTP diphosphatase
MPEYDRWAEKLCQVWVATPTRCLGPPTEAGHTAVWAGMEESLTLIENEGERDFLRRWL